MELVDDIGNSPFTQKFLRYARLPLSALPDLTKNDFLYDCKDILVTDCHRLQLSADDETSRSGISATPAQRTMERRTPFCTTRAPLLLMYE